MAAETRNPHEIIDTESYRLDNLIISGKALKYLILKAKKEKEPLRQLASKMFNLYVEDRAANSKLTSGDWLPEKQLKVTSKTFKK